MLCCIVLVVLGCAIANGFAKAVAVLYFVVLCYAMLCCDVADCIVLCYAVL